jgi:hypothetical protein
MSPDAILVAIVSLTMALILAAGARNGIGYVLGAMGLGLVAIFALLTG